MICWKFTRPRWWGCLLLIALLAIPASAQVGGMLRVFIPGVDAAGNLSEGLGNPGLGRSYYDPETGIVILMASGRVKNMTKAQIVFENFGFMVFDPATNEYRVATSDTLAVTAPFRRLGNQDAGANLVAVYDPGGFGTGPVTSTGAGTTGSGGRRGGRPSR